MKKLFEENSVLLMTEEKDKKHYALIKDFNTFIYDHTLHCGRKHFGRYCLQAFSTAEILTSHVNDCLKINRKQMIKMPKTGEYVRFKNYEKKNEISIYELSRF